MQYGSSIYQTIDQTTDIDGSYAFGYLPSNNNYRISAEKNNDFLNGVSTLDIIHIQRHILGTKHFDSAFDMIAGDINNDRELTTIDLIELRKLILGIYDELPNNKSWKFGSDKQWLSVDAPWSFSEDIYCLLYTSDAADE